MYTTRTLHSFLQLSFCARKLHYSVKSLITVHKTLHTMLQVCEAQVGLECCVHRSLEWDDDDNRPGSPNRELVLSFIVRSPSVNMPSQRIDALVHRRRQ